MCSKKEFHLERYFLYLYQSDYWCYYLSNIQLYLTLFFVLTDNFDGMGNDGLRVGALKYTNGSLFLVLDGMQTNLWRIGISWKMEKIIASSNFLFSLGILTIICVASMEFMDRITYSWHNSFHVWCHLVLVRLLSLEIKAMIKVAIHEAKSCIDLILYMISLDN